MPSSLFKTLRYRLVFSIWWFSWAEVHAIVLTHLGLSWKLALYDSLISNVFLAGVSFLISITLYYYIPAKNKYVYITALVTVLTLLWLLITRSILLRFIGEEDAYNSFFSKSIIIRAAFGLLINGCVALLGALWQTVQDQQEIERRKTEVEALSREAELFRLREQLQPHFPFNSLNSINALISLQPQEARKMVQLLSDFLRGTLKKEEHQWVALEDEFMHLQLYLAIEKVRFGHRLPTVIINETGKDRVQIPVMLLQPLVENAIKFGLYDTTGDITISISAWIEKDSLFVQVKNPFDSETSSPKKGTGFGLSSVQRRLYLLFARNDLLMTTIGESTFTTTLKIPQQ